MLEGIRRGHPVAQEREVAGGAAACRQAGKRACEVGHRLERGAHALTANCILMQPGNQREPLLDCAALGERRGDVFAQQPASCGGLATVDFPKQAAGDAAAGRARQLEAVAACCVDCHVARPSDAPRDVEQDARAFLRRVEIGEQPARSGEFGARGRSEPVERRQAKARLERAFAGGAVEPTLAGRRTDARHGGVGDRLGWRKARKFRGKFAWPAVHQLETAGGDIGGSDRPILADAPDCRQPVGRGGFEQSVLGQRSGRHQANDRAVHQCLGSARLARFGGAFSLLGDGDPVSATD